MQQYSKLTNSDKAGILYDLFPSVVPEFLSYLREVCNEVLRCEEKVRTEMQHGIISAELWLQQARCVRSALADNLKAPTKIFFQELFSDPNKYLFVVVHSLLSFEAETALEQRFHLMGRSLFDVVNIEG